MVDTPRSMSYLTTTEFQDGQAPGSIRPQFLRDLIVSVYPTEATAGQNNLDTPNIMKMRPRLVLDTSGTQNYGATINAFIADCVNHGHNAGYLTEGSVLVETPIVNPGQFDLIGEGRVDGYHQKNTGNLTAGQLAWWGGVKLLQPNLSRKNVLQIAGTNTGNSVTTMIQNAGFHNLHVIGQLNGATATAGASATGTITANFSITAASKTLTADASVFASYNVGSYISVAGAGAGGAALVSTIKVVNTPTTCTLNDAASTTITASNQSFFLPPPLGSATANFTPGGPGTLLSVYSAYRMRLENLQFGGFYTRHALFSNVWDSDVDMLSSFGGGFADPTASPTDAAVMAYTGRSPIALETLLNRSFGVPAVEIVSPNVFNGLDATNNLRFKSLHIESSANNSVGLMVRGPNGVMISIHGKIECDEGANPLIVLQNQNAFRFEGWLNGGGSGTNPAAFGGVAQGYAWKTDGNPGMVLAHTCYSPRFKNGAIGYAGVANSAPLTAYFRFIACDNPQVEYNATQGLDSLVSGGSRILLDNCTKCDNVHVRAAAYVLSIANTVKTHTLAINSTTEIGTTHTGGVRKITGTTATDTPTFDDRGALILSSGSVALTATVNDLGPGVRYRYKQTTSGGVVTATAGAGVTLVPNGANLVTLGVGTGIEIECNGDGTVSVATLMTALPSSKANVQTFDGAQTTTYTPIGGTSLYRIEGQAPGGGGGSGGRVTAGTAISGGGGGGGGGFIDFTLTGAEMGGSAVTIVIGAPGAGGTAPTTDSTAGNAGTSGGSIHFGAATTQFGSRSFAGGGGGGAGGQIGAASGGGGSSSQGTGSSAPAATASTGGSATGLGTAGGSGVTGTNVQSILVGGPGGGSGASGAAGNGGGSLGAGGGGSGGGITTASAGTNGGVGGVGGGNAGGIAGTAGTPTGGTPTSPLTHVSGQGAGGGRADTGSGGAGGAGLQGGGGGGGGSCQNGGTAGAGGAGGAGWIRVTAFS